MDQNKITMRLQAVINTLSAATLRADQLDAVQRINACTHELRSVISDMEKEDQTNMEKEG